MSAVLSPDDLQPVADLIEQVMNVQRAIADLKDAQTEDLSDPVEFSCAITCHPRYGKELPCAHTHRLPFWIVLQGLTAMERELAAKLSEKGITVGTVLS